VSHGNKAKGFLLLGATFGIVAIVSGIAAIVEFVRGFSAPPHWFHMLGWMFGGAVSKSLAFQYRDTSDRYSNEGIGAGSD
jgi:hypothetical protein